jgi:ribosomal protein S18 acetylase RimI-like enzyme
MRIGVRSKCQRQGIGKKLMDYLFNKYPNHLSLDVSSDNVKAVHFYHKCGLALVETYLSEDKVEFNKFETPLGFIAPAIK